jgi:hypothetical protein
VNFVDDLHSGNHGSICDPRPYEQSVPPNEMIDIASHLEATPIDEQQMIADAFQISDHVR